MAGEFKTRGEAISAYANAFREDSTGKKAAEILYGLFETLASLEGMGKECKIFYLKEEIDDILCGYIEARKDGATE